MEGGREGGMSMLVWPSGGLLAAPPPPPLSLPLSPSGPTYRNTLAAAAAAAAAAVETIVLLPSLLLALSRPLLPAAAVAAAGACGMTPTTPARPLGGNRPRRWGGGRTWRRRRRRRRRASCVAWRRAGVSQWACRGRRLLLRPRLGLQRRRGGGLVMSVGAGVASTWGGPPLSRTRPSCVCTSACRGGLWLGFVYVSVCEKEGGRMKMLAALTVGCASAQARPMEPSNRGHGLGETNGKSTRTHRGGQHTRWGRCAEGGAHR